MTKKICLGLALIAAISFTACGSDSSSNAGDDFDDTMSCNVKEDGNTLIYESNNYGLILKQTYTFNEDGSYTLVYKQTYPDRMKAQISSACDALKAELEAEEDNGTNLDDIKCNGNTIEYKASDNDTEMKLSDLKAGLQKQCDILKDAYDD